MIVQNINSLEFITSSTLVNNDLTLSVNKSKNAHEIYAFQDDDTSMLINTVTGGVGTITGAAAGALLGGAIGNAPGAVVGGIVGAVVGIGFGSGLGEAVSGYHDVKLNKPVNPNHYYAMGTGPTISDGTSDSEHHCTSSGYNGYNPCGTSAN